MAVCRVTLCRNDNFLEDKLMTKSLATTMVLVALTVSGAALAQTSGAPAAGTEMNRATTTGPTTNTDRNSAVAPVARANSFTEGEARNRIEKSGYSNVSGLKKDAQGVWQGTAMKDGKSTAVALDFKGNIVPMAQSAQVPPGLAPTPSPAPVSGPTR